MNKPTNIMLDSCVSFEMLPYSRCYEIYGREIVESIIEKRKEKLEELEKLITSKFVDEFNDKYQSYTFDQKIAVYKTFNLNKVNTLNKVFKKYYFKSMGKSFNKETGKYEFNDRISEKTKSYAKENFENIKNTLKTYHKYNEKANIYYLDRNNNYIANDIHKYKNLKMNLSAGQLFLDMLDGKYKFHIPSVSLKELEDHTRDKSAGQNNNQQNNNQQNNQNNNQQKNEKWLKVNAQTLQNFIKNYATITYSNDNKTNALINSLAAQYRIKQNSNYFKAMDEDKNHLKDYGDSKIMAMASLAGMPLATYNCKDFIYEKVFKEGNSKKKNKLIEVEERDKIRKYIAFVNSKHKYATDAYAYSVDEILEGRYHIPTRRCRLDKFENKNIKFFKDLDELLDIVSSNNANKTLNQAKQAENKVENTENKTDEVKSEETKNDESAKSSETEQSSEIAESNTETSSEAEMEELEVAMN